MKDMPLSLGIHSGKNATLRALLASKKLLIAPGVFDCLTARLAEQAGAKAIYMTGSGVSITRLGAPDIAILSFAEILDQAKRICDVTALPLIADADTGYGGPLNIMRTVREMERAGVSGIQIEDQDWPKRCGHEPGRRIVSIQEMVGRIRAAVDTRQDEQTVIVARTDARSSEGIQAAIDRANIYAEAGADVAFVESPETPTLANQVEGGRTPMLPGKELEELGYGLAIYPNSITRVFASIGNTLYTELLKTGSTKSMSNQMLDHRGLWNLFEYAAFIELENNYTSKDDKK